MMADNSNNANNNSNRLVELKLNQEKICIQARMVCLEAHFHVEFKNRIPQVEAIGQKKLQPDLLTYLINYSWMTISER